MSFLHFYPTLSSSSSYHVPIHVLEYSPKDYAPIPPYESSLANCTERDLYGKYIIYTHIYYIMRLSMDARHRVSEGAYMAMSKGPQRNPSPERLCASSQCH